MGVIKRMIKFKLKNSNYNQWKERKRTYRMDCLQTEKTDKLKLNSHN